MVRFSGWGFAFVVGAARGRAGGGGRGGGGGGVVLF